MPARYCAVIADDDANIRDLLRTYLIGAGFDVHMARDGTEVEPQLRRARPDLLILDINMPKLDGFAVLQALKSATEHRHVPVLVLTARHAVDDVKKAVSLGAKDYLTKPFTQGQLLARVARLLRRPDLAGSPSLKTAE